MNDERQKKIVTEARAFTEEHIRPFAGEFEEKKGVPRGLINKLAERKYLAAPFPEEYGGLGMDQYYYGLLVREIGKGCPSTRALLTVHTSLVGETILKWGSRELKEKWLPLMARGEKIAAFGLTEPYAGTDAQSIQTAYNAEGDTCILNGRKKWITFSGIADLFIIIACNEDKKTTAFLVERQQVGVEVIPMQGLLASRAAYISEIKLKDVRVPRENILGKEGSGFSFIVNTALDNGRYNIAWAGVAIAEAALEEMVTYARSRSQFGQKIYKFQLVHEMITDAVTKVQAAEALCKKAGEMRTNKHLDAVMQATIAKYYSSRIAMEVTTDAVQIHGGNGCYNQYPVERLFREAKILEIIEGTSQIQQEIISRYGLSHYKRKIGHQHTGN
jgi:hypothetical protein